MRPARVVTAALGAGRRAPGARLLAACAALLWGAPAFAGSGGGANAFEFLSLDANARAVGMAGAYTALASDANALLYNPAGLGLVRRHEATFMHNQHVEGVYQEYAGFAARQGWGLQVNYLGFGGIQKTRISNKDGAGLGSYGMSDLALGGGYGRMLGEALGLGIGGKFIREAIDNVSGTGFAADLGAICRVPQAPGLTLGVSLLNLGPGVKFQGDTENLPMRVRGGAAYAFQPAGVPASVAVDVSQDRDDAPAALVGLEAVVAGRLPVRFGYSSRSSAGPGITAGLGWVVQDWAVDYAIVPFGDLGYAHRMSVTFKWGRKRSLAPPPERRGPPSALEWPSRRSGAARPEVTPAIPNPPRRPRRVDQPVEEETP